MFGLAAGLGRRKGFPGHQGGPSHRRGGSSRQGAGQFRAIEHRSYVKMEV